MGKFLLLVLLGVVIYLLLARARQASRGGKASAARPADATMTRCAYCGLHAPADECVIVDARSYCCEEHRRLGEG